MLPSLTLYLQPLIVEAALVEHRCAALSTASTATDYCAGRNMSVALLSQMALGSPSNNYTGGERFRQRLPARVKRVEDQRLSRKRSVENNKCRYQSH